MEQHDIDLALQYDQEDPLASFRNEFHIPTQASLQHSSNDASNNQQPCIYLCGNSLGLSSKPARDRVLAHLDHWAAKGVEGHFTGKEPWVNIEDWTSTPSAMDLVGAKHPHEVVYMNSLTVNLHLLMVAFYRPTHQKYKIMIEDKAFPSDHYAVTSQIDSFMAMHPDRFPDLKTQCSNSSSDESHPGLVLVKPRPGTDLLDELDLLNLIRSHAHELALVLLPGVQYYTGQVLPMQSIASECSKHGIFFGLDLAHAVGNIPLQLHDWNVDFAVWCSYKYLNSGPGALAGAFLHHKYASGHYCEDAHGHHIAAMTTGSAKSESETQYLHRFAGWWGTQRSKRFQMGPEFMPQPGIYGFQLSNPPVFAIAPVMASLELFGSAGGIQALRTKSVKLTGFLEYLLDKYLHEHIHIISPRDFQSRGCQLSLKRVSEHGERHVKTLNEYLGSHGVICDTREPDVLRVAPVPMYNSFMDVLRFVELLIATYQST